MPLWNEILQVSVPSLPCSGTLRLEITCVTEQMLGNVDLGPTFGFILTDALECGFSDEFLAGNMSEIVLNNPGIENTTVPKLHISCSFNRDIILARQKGLWPAHNVHPPCTALSTDISVSELMKRSALVHRQRLQSPIDHESQCVTHVRRLGSPIRGIVQQHASAFASQRRPASPDRRLSEHLEQESCAGKPPERRLSEYYLYDGCSSPDDFSAAGGGAADTNGNGPHRIVFF
jgi:hypothetical protein